MKSHVARALLASFVIITSAALFYAADMAGADSSSASKAAAARWEHLALTHNGADVVDDNQLSAQIVKTGNDGWELVCVTTVVKDGTTTKTTFYFKRPK